ncbi:GNAT family N-acetyltransferase [Aliikangiella marina]|uniref:GNAT family N-acetyltransferase n=1 Tax=Aliikangiella marina TaxID=1712262 RepID=A0A545TD00_9GAMM|nr:GNAT family N-acetyltransferase [Aliikangiella marina]TQV75102.1 GNAT family N-acetyltransferase [Aliikangiella marina]
MTKIIEATSQEQIEIARDLFREYQSFLGEDLCFQGFEQELAELPGKYADPTGAILLAEHQEKIIGCVAVRPIEGEVCEMKRLFVRTEAQGLSAGRLLAEAIIARAHLLGYKKMQLDTLERLVPALALYEKLGFKRIEPYYANPLNEVVYLELELN